MPGLEVDRVAEILVTLSAGEPRRRGSGYQVNADTVLTAAHVVRGGSVVQVRFDADQPGEWSADVTSVLEVPEADIALLTITPHDDSQVTPTRFGRIRERDAEITCSAVGFPLWKLRDGPGGLYRDSAHVVGKAPLFSNTREKTLEINVAPPERDLDPKVSPWEGMSGAAVFCDGQIVGVINKHHRCEGLGRLTASRADGWREKVSATDLQQLEARLGVPAACARGAVTADLFAAGSGWGRLADDVQGYLEDPADPLIGREWLTAQVDAFFLLHDSGYFVIEGGAGMGKTAFAAWFARREQCSAHFAERSQKAGEAVVPVRNLGGQLIASWDLDHLAPTGMLPPEAGREDPAEWLLNVIRAAARRRDQVSAGAPIILVADAVNAAVDPPDDHPPLGLPDPGLLPRGVYVVATARTGGLRYLPEGCASRSLDEAREENLADMRQYLASCARSDYITRAIASADISPGEFTELLADRSTGVWIYIHYVLEQIRVDPHMARELPALPRGLDAWYHKNLARLVNDGPDGPLTCRCLRPSASLKNPCTCASCRRSQASPTRESSTERSTALIMACSLSAGSGTCPEGRAAVSRSSIPACGNISAGTCKGQQLLPQRRDQGCGSRT